MHLMRVDLPAPLSPTSAMTSPEATWKSTSKRAWTAPKDLETFRSSSIGESGGAGWRPPVSVGHYRPASVHFLARSPAQISSFFGKSGSPM